MDAKELIEKLQAWESQEALIVAEHVRDPKALYQWETYVKCLKAQRRLYAFRGMAYLLTRHDVEEVVPFVKTDIQGAVNALFQLETMFAENSATQLPSLVDKIKIECEIESMQQFLKLVNIEE